MTNRELYDREPMSHQDALAVRDAICCPECGGPTMGVGGSSLRWHVNGVGSADIDSVRCEDHEMCDGGLEVVVSPARLAGIVLTMEGKIVAN